jgi:hypothetical protein
VCFTSIEAALKCTIRRSALTFNPAPLPFLRIRKTSMPEALYTEIALPIPDLTRGVAQ